MGDKISIQFKNKRDNTESAILISHWDGVLVKNMAHHFISTMKASMKERSQINTIGTPISRMEPESLMCNFITFLLRDPEDIFHTFRLINNSQIDRYEVDGKHCVIYTD